MQYDKVIIGAGLYGLYAALFCAKRKETVLVIEYDKQPFTRATYVNQARVHMGYHYPRSLSTAMKSAGYFERFVRDFSFSINREFKKIYAISKEFSWTDAEEFRKFCEASGIYYRRLHEDAYFKDGMCDGTFLTKEYTYDAMILRDYFMEQLQQYHNVHIMFQTKIDSIRRDSSCYELHCGKKGYIRTPFLLNATYASTNQILNMLGYEKLAIKYELCEIILCQGNQQLQNIGITVMDGPFFSIMPFGKTGLHSLTSVTFTPHMASDQPLPEFSCQIRSNGHCSPEQLGNCSSCPARPVTAYPYMAHLAEKYLREEYHFSYCDSLFSMKPILLSSEIDDSRPTVVREYTKNPTFVSVLSGKINTVYDLDEVLCREG